MLKVTVEVVPFGREEEKYAIHTVYIANDRQLRGNYCEYYAYVDEDPRPFLPDHRPAAHAKVAHDRLRGALELVGQVLLRLRPKKARLVLKRKEQ